MNEKEKEVLKKELNGFHGTNHYYRTSPFLRHVVHTDGVQYLAEKASCFWLLDTIVSWQTKERVRKELFQVWKLTKEQNGWLLKAHDGGKEYDEQGEPVYQVLAMQKFTASNFPLDEMTFYLEAGSVGVDGEEFVMVLMLPSER